jgi:ribonuclease HII
MLSTRFKDDNMIEIGLDEAGRGSFWGPIMAGALVIPNESVWTDKHRVLLTQLRDSKKISPKKREKLADDIKELIPQYAIGMVETKEINEHGIYWANIEAFKRAIKNLDLDESKCRLLIDGDLSIQGWNGEQSGIANGDSEYLAIAGASILAKVEHDKWIQNYCTLNPECDERYDLCKSKGYGTVKHREGIRTYGGHSLHRELFIQNWLADGSKRIKKSYSPKNNIANDKCIIKFK